MTHNTNFMQQRIHHKHTHTHTQPFKGLWSRTSQVGRYQKKHSPTHTHPDHRTSFTIFLRIQWSMASSLFILRVVSYNLSPGPLWSSSWSWTLNFILHTFLHPIIIIFSQHTPIPTQPVLPQHQRYVIYTQSLSQLLTWESVFYLKEYITKYNAFFQNITHCKQIFHIKSQENTTLSRKL